MRALLSSLAVLRGWVEAAAAAPKRLGRNAAQLGMQHSDTLHERHCMHHLARACTTFDLVRSMLHTQQERVPGQLQPFALCKGRKLLPLRTAALAHA